MRTNGEEDVGCSVPTCCILAVERNAIGGLRVLSRTAGRYAGRVIKGRCTDHFEIENFRDWFDCG